MIFQEPMTSLNPVFTVGFQIEEVLRCTWASPAPHARKRAVEVLAEVGIPEPERRINYFPSQMSGGQQQRVMIAMAIACEPKLLIADEPTTALDVTIQKQILELIAELQKKHQMSVLFITHDLAVVGEIADYVIVMRNGEIREQGPAKQVFEAPRDAYTKALLLCRPQLDRRPVRLARDRRLHARRRCADRIAGADARRGGLRSDRAFGAQPVQELLRPPGALRQARVQGREERLVRPAEGQDARASSANRARARRPSA